MLGSEAAFIEALTQLIQPLNIGLLILGVGLGIIIGIIPGLGAPLGIAIALPFTFYISPIQAFSLLLGIYSGAIYGGSVSAIMLGIPGTPPAAATLMDGYPMMKAGRGGEALTYSLVGSVIGGLFSTVCLMLIAPVLATFAMQFGPSEYFALGVFGIMVVGKVAGDNVFKGFIMGALGIFLTTFGIDPVNANMRFTFGSVDLYAGISFIPLLVGLFAVPEMMFKCEDLAQRVLPKSALNVKLPGVKALYRFKNVLLRSAIIGTIVGIIPAEGGAVGAFISYGEAKRCSKEPEKFGQGAPEGVLAPETANNATIGGALIPTLTLGVPGSAAAAILLGALMIHGFTPGPRLFSEAPDLMYSIFIGLFIINIIMLFLGMGAIGSAAKIIKVPDRIIIPVVLLLCFLGSYSIKNSMFGVWVMLWAGLFGYIMRKFGFPIIPCVLGFVLGPMIEVNFRQALTISDGNWLVFIDRPISLIIYGLILLTFVSQPLMDFIKRARKNG
ncbi:MAG: tripartite tricarboxylate transporter permease [Desulfarculaceae bacterium]|jgi:putative tricarboxylic transport membrane protein